MNFQNLCELISGVVSVDQTVNKDSRLASDLGLCSFDMMLLLFKIEEATGKTIDASNLESDMTVEELLEVIALK